MDIFLHEEIIYQGLVHSLTLSSCVSLRTLQRDQVGSWSMERDGIKQAWGGGEGGVEATL